MRGLLDAQAILLDRGRDVTATAASGPMGGLSPSTDDMRRMRAMVVALVFLMGVANFALHQAVRLSGHPILEQMQWFRAGNGKATLALEFLVLLAALALAMQGLPGIAWGYGFYTALNALAAWLLLRGT